MKKKNIAKRIVNHKIHAGLVFFMTFLKWVGIASMIGIIGGVIGGAFHMSVALANDWRLEHQYIVMLLPISGLAIVAMYRITNMVKNKGTNDVLDSVRDEGDLPLRTAPLIFVSTVITHLFGGSAGREGAALQLGGSIGSFAGKLFKLEKSDMHMVIMCGMSALFAALFGTPLTSVIFAIEVVSVGIMYYSALIPCTAAALIAYSVTLHFGIEPTHFDLTAVPDVTFVTLGQTAFIAVLCAVLSILFCMLLHTTEKGFKNFIKNEYLRIALGGALVLIMTILVQTPDYNGSGAYVIEEAVAGKAKPLAFVLKMIFTAVTIGAGFKGGEIVPTFFIGATFGCFMASLIGMEPGFGAAVGMIGMFCGMLNCPVASIILSIELFGQQGLVLFAITAGISYMLSGYYSLYHSQIIVYSKLTAKYINKNAKEVL